MRKRLLATALTGAALTLAISGNAAAQDRPIHLGVGLGYMLPMGQVQGDMDVAGTTVKGADLSEVVSGGIALPWVEAGYFLTPQVEVGLYLNYGLLSVADDSCPDGADCSASLLRYGLQGQFHLGRGESTDIYFGLGLGLENVSTTVEAGGQSADGSISGMELNLLAGADFQVADGIALGPMVSFSLGQYSSAEAGGKSADIEEKALHQWLTLGVKGSFGF